MRISRSWQALILLPLVLPGCYVPAPADPASLAPGDDLRIVLSDEGTQHLADISTEVQAEVVGQLRLLTQDSLSIATRLAGPVSAGSAFGSLRQILTFARADIVQVTVPELNGTRTGFVVAGIAVASVVLLAGFGIISATGIPGEGPDPTAPFRARR